MNINIKAMKNSPYASQEDVTKIFVESFYNLYSGFAKDKKQLEDILLGSFQTNSFFIAYIDKQPVGLLGYSDNKNRALTLNKKKFRTSLGLIKGSIAYSILKKEFHSPLNYDDHVGYIEFIATIPQARGKRVAQSLMTYFFQNSEYKQYILEVGDTNKSALNLYKKVGFKEFDRKPDKHSKQTGFNTRIYMIHEPKQDILTVQK